MMREVVLHRALAWLSAVAIVVAANGAQAQVSAADQAHIAHIFGGLAPAVIVAGEPATTAPLAARMSALHVPGVSIAFVHDGRVAWARGFGVARLGGAPVTDQTLFQAGSISKPVTAAVVLRLAQSGKLDLDADVDRYLDSWKLPPTSFTAVRKVTLRRLLSHTAGVTVHGFPGYAAGAPVPTLTQVLDGAPPANTPPIRVDTTPGMIWRYSGGGYVIIQQLLDDVTGERFPDLMRRELLGPIGMDHSTFEQPLPASMQGEAATPYQASGAPVPGGAHTYPEMAPAGLWTTPTDLARFVIVLQRAIAGKSSRVLSQFTAQEMVKDVGLGHWGLGLEVGGGPAHPYFGHGGADAGFQSDMEAFDTGDGVVIMTNSDRGGELAEEILRTVALEYDWPAFQPPRRAVVPVDPARLDRYVGRYQLAPRAVLTVARVGSGLTVQLTGQGANPMFPDGPDDFFLAVVDATLTFQTGAGGTVTGVVLHQGGQDLPAPRIAGQGAPP